MKLVDGFEFEVCFDCSDESMYRGMGYELARKNRPRRIS
jgi:hypothetical protein